MSLSNREMLLGWAVGLLILFGLSFWFLAPKVRIWKEIRASRKQVAERMALSERLLQSQDQWTRRLDALKTKLTKYAADKDATADYLKIMERVAKDNNLNLVQRRPQKEKRHGDLYEMAIDCTWDGNLEALIRFLYALERENVTMNIEDLSVSLEPGGKGLMKGNFTLICVYARDGAPPPAPGEKKEPAGPGGAPPDGRPARPGPGQPRPS